MYICASALYKTWEPDNLDPDSPHREPSRLPVGSSLLSSLWNSCKFSVLSMVNIKIGDVQLGPLVAKLFGAEYSYQPTGIVKIVSSLQTLLTLGLSAAWFIIHYSSVLVDFDWLS